MEVFFRLDTICSGRDVALIGSSQHTMGSNNFVHISMALFVHESLRNIKAIILQTDVCENAGPLIVNQWLWVLLQSLSGLCPVLVWSLSIITGLYNIKYWSRSAPELKNLNLLGMFPF